MGPGGPLFPGALPPEWLFLGVFRAGGGHPFRVRAASFGAVTALLPALRRSRRSRPGGRLAPCVVMCLPSHHVVRRFLDVLYCLPRGSPRPSLFVRRLPCGRPAQCRELLFHLCRPFCAASLLGGVRLVPVLWVFIDSWVVNCVWFVFRKLRRLCCKWYRVLCFCFFCFFGTRPDQNRISLLGVLDWVAPAPVRSNSSLCC